jgi:hypothetical protein
VEEEKGRERKKKRERELKITERKKASDYERREKSV